MDIDDSILTVFIKCGGLIGGKLAMNFYSIKNHRFLQYSDQLGPLLNNVTMMILYYI